MKVNLGKYVSWFGPYQLANLLVFWKKDKENLSEKIGDFLCDTPVEPILQTIYKNKKRKEFVQIDDHDIWNLDHTLALIIHPALVKFREQHHSGAFVDDEDVPEELRANAPVYDENYDVDDKYFDRWNYVLDEMIFAFNHYVDATEINSSHDDVWNEVSKKHMARVNNGLRLFGKYYGGLWD